MLLRVLGAAAVLAIALLVWRAVVARPGAAETYCVPGSDRCAVVIPHPTTRRTR